MTDKDHPRRCKAMLTSGERRCKNMALKGQRVCRFHGGGAPQNLAAAKRRLAALAEPAIGALERAMHKAENAGLELHPQVIKLALKILDRTGFGPGVKIEVDAKQDHRWLAYCTKEEKQTVLKIAQRAVARMEKAQTPQ